MSSSILKGIHRLSIIVLVYSLNQVTSAGQTRVHPKSVPVYCTELEVAFEFTLFTSFTFHQRPWAPRG